MACIRRYILFLERFWHWRSNPRPCMCKDILRHGTSFLDRGLWTLVSKRSMTAYPQSMPLPTHFSFNCVYILVYACTHMCVGGWQSLCIERRDVGCLLVTFVCMYVSIYLSIIYHLSIYLSPIHLSITIYLFLTRVSHWTWNWPNWPDLLARESPSISTSPTLGLLMALSFFMRVLEI